MMSPSSQPSVSSAKACVQTLSVTQIVPSSRWYTASDSPIVSTGTAVPCATSATEATRIQLSDSLMLTPTFESSAMPQPRSQSPLAMNVGGRAIDRFGRSFASRLAVGSPGPAASALGAARTGATIPMRAAIATIPAPAFGTQLVRRARAGAARAGFVHRRHARGPRAGTGRGLGVRAGVAGGAGAGHSGWHGAAHGMDIRGRPGSRALISARRCCWRSPWCCWGRRSARRRWWRPGRGCWWALPALWWLRSRRATGWGACLGCGIAWRCWWLAATPSAAIPPSPPWRR